MKSLTAREDELKGIEDSQVNKPVDILQKILMKM
jgi:hypothetical protein